MADSLEELCDSHATKLAVLLRELGQPKVRLGLSVIAIYYNESLKPFLDFTENDDGDMFTRVHRVLRQRYTWLADIANDANSTSLAWVTDFEPFQTRSTCVKRDQRACVRCEDVWAARPRVLQAWSQRIL